MLEGFLLGGACFEHPMWNVFASRPSSTQKTRNLRCCPDLELRILSSVSSNTSCTRGESGYFMDSTVADRQQRLRLSFDAIAADYERLGFVHACAARLLELAHLQHAAHVLDVGTGTGLVALAAARVVGKEGSVTGLDFSARMLESAHQQLARTNLTNVSFVQGTAENLEFPDLSFDAVLCASALFFVPDMVQAVREFYRVLKPGARVGFTSFGTGFLQPVSALLTARLERHGVPPAQPPVARLADPDACKQLLEDAGFTDVQVISEQVGYFLTSFGDRWLEIRAGLEGLPLERLPADVVERIRQEHEAELEGLFTAEGLWINVPANFVMGTKPPAL